MAIECKRKCLVECKNRVRILDCHEEVKLIAVVQNTNATTTLNNISNDDDGVMFTEEEKQQMMLYFGYATVTIILFRPVFLQFILTMSLFVAPIVYIFLRNACPPDASFDVKKELRRGLARTFIYPNTIPTNPKDFCRKHALGRWPLLLRKY